MEWEPYFNLRKSKENLRKEMINSLVAPLGNLQAEIAQTGPYDKKVEEIYVNKASPPVTYLVTDKGFIISKDGKQTFYQTAEEFVKHLPFEDARSIARKKSISLG